MLFCHISTNWLTRIWPIKVLRILLWVLPPAPGVPVVNDVKLNLTLDEVPYLDMAIDLSSFSTH